MSEKKEREIAVEMLEEETLTKDGFLEYMKSEEGRERDPKEMELYAVCAFAKYQYDLEDYKTLREFGHVNENTGKLISQYQPLNEDLIASLFKYLDLDLVKSNKKVSPENVEKLEALLLLVGKE